MVVRKLKITNITGLHARPSAKIAQLVEDHDADAIISKDGLEAGGDSIMGLLMLAASHGTFITVETSGPQAEALAEAIEALVTDQFGEGP